jgi:hypothetical protein
VRALPPGERQKIESIAKFVVSILSGRGERLDRIELRGHADTDTPRRPAFEMQVSIERAQQTRAALSAAIDRIAATRPGPAQLPPFSSRIDWRISGAGASRLAIPNARTEVDRAHNRRVEILVHRRPVPRPSEARRLALVGKTSRADVLDVIIQEFLGRIGEADIDRKNCFAAGSRVIEILEPGAPAGLKCGDQIGSQLATSKDYRAPFSRGIVRCCAWNADCSVTGNRKGCGHCSGIDGPYLILGYPSKPLMHAVDRAKCVLDQGCVVRAGVLSGICDDKPDLGCAKTTPPNEVWRTCPEHWLVIIGYMGDTFVFWDSARMSRLAKGGHEFGLLHYNRTENRLTTAEDLAKMDVNPSGFHTWNTNQKRYQALVLRVGGRYKPAIRSC